MILEVIVPFEKEYLEDVVDIEKESFFRPYTRDVFEKLLTDEDSPHDCIVTREKCIVVIVDSKIVAGYLMFEETRKECRVISLAIRHDYRGHSLGEYLMTNLIQKSKAPCLSLHVLANNIPAQKLYIKLGFKARKWDIGYYRDEGDGLFMILKK